MTVMTAEERADLADRMLPVAANLAVLVHGDGGPRDIHQAIARLNPAEKDALLVVLAALVDVDRPVSGLLGWVPDLLADDPQAEEDAERSETTLRAIAAELVEEDLASEVLGADGSVLSDVVDLTAVEQFLAGHRVDLRPQEKIAAVLEGQRRGLSYQDLDAMFGVRPGNTSTMMSRARKAAAAKGLEIPGSPMAVRTFSEAEVVRIRERSAAGETDLSIALSVGVTRKAIGDIVTGVTYGRIGGPIRTRRPASEPARKFCCPAHFGRARLTASELETLRVRRAKGEHMEALAAEAGICEETLRQLLAGRMRPTADPVAA